MGSSLSGDGGLSGLKSDSSLELGAKGELGLGWRSFATEELLKINGWYTGGEKETFCQAKNSTYVLLCKGERGDITHEGEGEIELGIKDNLPIRKTLAYAENPSQPPNYWVMRSIISLIPLAVASDIKKEWRNSDRLNRWQIYFNIEFRGEKHE